MCGRFSLFEPPDLVEARFEAQFDYPYERRYNAAPGQTLPVITDEHPDAIQAVEWGLVPPWADERDDAPTPINARGETVAETASFRQSFAGVDGHVDPEGEAAGRCLVLADGFYEWGATDDGKQPYRIARHDDEPFALAGLWTRWQPSTAQATLAGFEDGGDPDLVQTFAIVTTDANEVVEPIHDRMPVVLDRERERTWLTVEPEDAAELLTPAPADWLRAYPVSRAVNDPSNDRRSVVEEVDLPG